MITRVELENFMSHQHSVFELAEGLTVLLGENNSGKSAVVHAIQCLCENISGNYMIRHGTKECVVRIETADGHRIAWHRTKSTAWYEVDGKRFDRLGGRVPPELHQALRLPPLSDGSDKESYNVHLALQKEPIFLLHDTGGKRASFFASSSDAGKLMGMQTLHRQNTADARTREKLLLADEERQSTRVARLEEVPELEAELAALSTTYEDVVERLAEAETLRQLLRESHANEQVHAAASHLCHDVLEELPSPPHFHDTRTLADRIQRIRTGSRYVAQTSEKQHILCDLEGPPGLHETLPLQRLISNLQTALVAQGKPVDILAELDGLPAPPEDTSDPALTSIIRDLENHETLRTRQEEEANGLRDQENSAGAEWRDVLATLTVCPVCRQEIPSP